jgi:outer membrane protein assembly factor BamE
MTREQVRFILGTPLVADIFHAQRWDYIYSFRPGRGEMQQRRLAVFFEDNKLVRVAGDVVGAEPGEAEAAASAAAGARTRVIEIAGEAEKEESGDGDKKEKAEAGATPEGSAQAGGKQ